MSIASVEVTMLDTTLRDGAQSLPNEHQFENTKKPIIAACIARLGLGVIEAGFPATPSDAAEVAEVVGAVGQKNYEVSIWESDGTLKQTSKPIVIAGLSRTTAGDIEATWDAIKDAKRSRIHTFISTDPEHMRAKFAGKSPEDVLMMGIEAIRMAKSLTLGHPDASVEFSAEAASTTDENYLERVIKEVIYQGADVINIPDTVGQRDPIWMHEFYSKVISWVMNTNSDVTISAHNHNDLGQAVANTGMLVRAAAKYAKNQEQTVRVQLETAVCGLGERAGNADIFPVAASLFKFAKDMKVPVKWQFNPNESVAIANLVMHQAGFEVNRQSPIVGSDTNVHRSGIHSDGIIKGGHRIYTPYDPTFWGHRNNAIHEDGKYQGKAGKQAIQ
jgi:2-isopropylmalate synthase